MQYLLRIVKEIEYAENLRIVDLEIKGHRHRVILEYDTEKLEEINYAKAPLPLDKEIILDIRVSVYKAKRVFLHTKALPDSTWPYGLCKGVVRKVETYRGEYILLPGEHRFSAVSYKAQIDCGALTLDADLRRTRVRIGNWVEIDGTLMAQGIEEANQEHLVEAGHGGHQEGVLTE